MLRGAPDEISATAYDLRSHPVRGAPVSYLSTQTRGAHVERGGVQRESGS